MKKYFIFVGARPNFIKAAPLCMKLDELGVPYEIYHSGQHYDTNLSGIFHKQLNLDRIVLMDVMRADNPIVMLQSIIERTNKLIKERVREIRGVIVFGDVLTTYGVGLACSGYFSFPLIHIESGLRSFDLSMPEELIRIGVDHVSDVLFCPSDDAVENLKKEGRTRNVFMVGNIMIDCLKMCLPKIQEYDIAFSDNPYVVATIHRPENVDNSTRLLHIMSQLIKLSYTYKVIFPIHPRTRSMLEKCGMYGPVSEHVHFIEPLSYFGFMKLILNAKAVVTDSGGVQEETTYLNVPCFTVRKNTERPVTILLGTNRLIEMEDICQSVIGAVNKHTIIPPLWDGETSTRIANILAEIERA